MVSWNSTVAKLLKKVLPNIMKAILWAIRSRLRFPMVAGVRPNSKANLARASDAVKWDTGQESVRATMDFHIKGVHRNRISLRLIVSQGIILQGGLLPGMTIVNLAILLLLLLLLLHTLENLVMITHLLLEGLRHPEIIGNIHRLVVTLMTTDVAHLPMAKTGTDILRPITKIVMLQRPNLFTAAMADPLCLLLLPLPMIGPTDEMVIAMETILRLHPGPGLHFVGETTTTGCLRGNLPIIEAGRLLRIATLISIDIQSPQRDSGVVLKVLLALLTIILLTGMVMAQALAPISDLLLCLPLVGILAIILHVMIEIFRRLLVAIDALRVKKKSYSCLYWRHWALSWSCIYFSALLAGPGIVGRTRPQHSISIIF